jgi:hypothetical protein
MMRTLISFLLLFSFSGTVRAQQKQGPNEPKRPPAIEDIRLMIQEGGGRFLTKPRPNEPAHAAALRRMLETERIVLEALEQLPKKKGPNERPTLPPVSVEMEFHALDAAVRRIRIVQEQERAQDVQRLVDKLLRDPDEKQSSPNNKK